MATYIVDASNGVVTASIGSHHDIDELRDALPPGDMRAGLGLQRQVVLGNQIFHPGDRLVTSMASLSANTTEVRFQRAAWKRFPLSSFGGKLLGNSNRKKLASLQSLWTAH